ncbi:hypothetical protein [Clostridioides difficile]|nr:hypothetical protein [Clostridioides difficile]
MRRESPLTTNKQLSAATDGYKRQRLKIRSRNQQLKLSRKKSSL